MALCTWAALASGCESHNGLGGLDGAFESCGNGMDDDGDGQIDEQCSCGASENQSCFSGMYPFRLVGSCRDGSQTCTTVDSEEFGLWGSCIDDQLPGEESCEGTADEDCDGAIDEGCPCDTSDIRACAAEFNIFPCQPGRQTCRADGLWSGCEGARGPSAELCNDTLDNDCDGIVNEGCECIAAPETCDDGIDNDCDGEVDEPACAACEGDSCQPPWCGQDFHGDEFAAQGLPSFENNSRSNFHRLRHEIAYHQSGVLAFLLFDSRSPDQRVILSLRSVDGAVISDTNIEADPRSVDGNRDDPMLFDTASVFAEADGFWVVYRQAIDTTVDAETWNIRMARVDLDGNITLGPLTFGEGRAIGGVRVSGVPYLSWIDVAGRLRVQALDESLQPIDTAQDLGVGFEGARIRTLGGSDEGALGIIVADTESHEVLLHRLHPGQPPTREVLAIPETPVIAWDLASNRTSVLACWTDQPLSFGTTGETGCRQLPLLGPAVEPAFSAPSITIAASDCGYHFIKDFTLTHNIALGGIEVHRLLRRGLTERSTAAWSWGTRGQVGSLHAGADGTFIYAGGFLQPLDYTEARIFMLRPGPARPAGDCTAARSTACELLAQCCPSGECMVHSQGVGFMSYLRTTGAECNLSANFCTEDADAGACEADLAAGRSVCVSPGSLGAAEFYLPASCMFPARSGVGSF